MFLMNVLNKLQLGTAAAFYCLYYHFEFLFL